MQVFRILITGFLFLLFGVICMVGNLVFYPIVFLNLQRFKAVKKFVRFLIRHSWGLFLYVTQILKYQNSNSHILKSLGNSGEIIICNHPSLLDVVFFLSKLKIANCVVKGDLAKNIFLYPAIKAAGYILNTQNEEFLHSSIEALRNGESLIIFPEGSRTKDEIIFHKAAAYIAIKSAKFLTPVFLHMNPRSLKKGQKWYQTPKNIIKYEFKIATKIKIDEFYPQKPSPIRARLLHSELKKIYNKEFNNG